VPGSGEVAHALRRPDLVGGDHGVDREVVRLAVHTDDRRARVLILDEPTAVLGVKEGDRVLQLIRDVRDRALSVILTSHNMPHVFDRIHSQRLGRRATVITPQSHTMSEAVAIMTGAAEPPPPAA
jgi:ABC-type sugar transport system ATPase subunit